MCVGGRGGHIYIRPTKHMVDGGAMGRFMSPDWSAHVETVPYAKLDNPECVNLYGYLQNNPRRGVVPDGHCNPAVGEPCAEQMNEAEKAYTQDVNARSRYRQHSLRS